MTERQRFGIDKHAAPHEVQWPKQRVYQNGKILEQDVKPGGYILGNHDYPVSRYRAQHELLFQELHEGQYPVAFDVGETGCGKTTNVPIAALETGLFDRIYVGEPRIVLARATRERLVSLLVKEYGVAKAQQMVGFASASEKILHPDNVIIVGTHGYVSGDIGHRTDGELHNALLIVDEYHDRESEGDTVLEVGKARNVPSLVMSATINAEELALHHSRHDGTPAPILRMEGRMYPVEELYMEDATKAAVWCINKGYDVLYMLPRVADIQLEESKIASLAKRPHAIVPFHGELSLSRQSRALEPKGDVPRVILATEIGGTGLTFDVDAVINPGVVRTKTLQKGGVEALALQRPTKAKTLQITGRVGRIREGVAIHAPYSMTPKDLPPNPNEYDVPELQRMRPDSLIIRLGTAGMRLANMGELSRQIAKKLDFKELPTEAEIDRSLVRLRRLGALSLDNVLTETAYEMSTLAVDAQLARMIIEARNYSEEVRRYMIMAAGVAQYNGVVARNVGAEGYKLSHEHRADMLRDLDIYLHALTMSSRDQAMQGILPQRVEKISLLVDELYKREGLNPWSEDALPNAVERDELLRCMATGIEELFARKAAGRYRDPRDGRMSRRLLAESAVRPVPRVAGTPWNLETISRSAKLSKLHFITRAMEVDVSQLPYLVPERCKFEERDYEISADGEIMTHNEVIFDDRPTGYHIIKPIESVTEGLRDFVIKGLFQAELRHDELLPDAARKFRREVAELREMEHRAKDDLNIEYLLIEMQHEMDMRLPRQAAQLGELLAHVDRNHLRAFLSNRQRNSIIEASPTKVALRMKGGDSMIAKVRYDNHAAVLHVPDFNTLRDIEPYIAQLDGRKIFVKIADRRELLDFYEAKLHYDKPRA